MEEKIKELAKKYNIPEGLIIEAIQMEKKKIVLQNRNLVTEIIKLIEKYAASNS